MNMETSEILAELLLLLDPDVLKVLSAEDDDAPFGDQQGELVLLLVGQLRELETADLRADTRRELRDLHVGVFQPEEMRLCFIR